jgi:hypothetical protein
MERIWVQGVVKNGQVVLDAPLNLPDGTAVTVVDEVTPPATPKIVMTDEQFMEFTDFFTGKRSPAEWAEFVARIRGPKEAA